MIQSKNKINQAVGALVKHIAVGCTLGEGVQWHVSEQAFYWLDIEQSQLYRYHLASNNLQRYELPYRAGCFAFIDKQPSSNIIIAFSIGIAFYNINSSEIKWLDQPEINNEGNRFNDGRVDKQGRFFAGSMVENENKSHDLGRLYCVDAQHEVTEKLTNVTISNGLCWSNDGATLYHADSPTHQINQYDYCQRTSTLSNKRLFAQTDVNAFPDGSTIDGDGFMWNAQWGSSNVIRYAKNGDIDLILTLPVSQPTCAAIGGKNMDMLMVTSAKQGLTKQSLISQPCAGDVFIYQLHQITGIEEMQYQPAK